MYVKIMQSQMPNPVAVCMMPDCLKQFVLSPLLTAARDGDTCRLHQLVASGADLNQRQGFTALELAVAFHHTDTFDYLMTSPDIDLQHVIFVNITTLLLQIDNIQSFTSKNFLKKF